MLTDIYTQRFLSEKEILSIILTEFVSSLYAYKVYLLKQGRMDEHNKIDAIREGFIKARHLVQNADIRKHDRSSIASLPDMLETLIEQMQAYENTLRNSEDIQWESGLVSFSTTINESLNLRYALMQSFK